MSIHAQLKTRCLPLIEAFRDDLLKHDRQFLEDNPGMPFLHLTRQCGTHLISLPCASTHFPRNREHILDDTVKSVEYLAQSGSTRLALHFDGKTLREVTTADTLDVVRQWASRVRRMVAAEPFTPSR